MKKITLFEVTVFYISKCPQKYCTAQVCNQKYQKMHSFKEFNKKCISQVFSDIIQNCISCDITHLKSA